MATILNLSLDEKQALSDFYDDVKLKYEKRLERGLRSLFKQILDDLVFFYSVNGQIQNFRDYEQELTVLLKKSYREASKYFSEHYDREMSNQQDDGDNSELLVFLILLRKRATSDIFISIDRQIKMMAPLHSAQILRTTQNIIISELDKAATTLSGGTAFPTNSEVIKGAAPVIRDRNRNRAGAISTTEVGTATGIGSQAEDDIFNAAVNTQKKNTNVETILKPKDFEALLALELVKTWISLLDSAVREAHLSAHGQEVDVNKPFTVGGQRLMQPLDTSLGASLDNTIGCRCISISS